MSVYKSKASPFYRYDFWADSRRFHGTTKTRNKRDAEAIERRLKETAEEEAKLIAATGAAPLTFDVAAGRYWTEVGQYWSRPQGYHAVIARLVDHFGMTRLDQIDYAAVARLIDIRRREPRWGKTTLKHGTVRPVGNTTINNHVLKPLKTIFRRARVVWGYHLPKEPIWRELKLKQRGELVRELDDCEKSALDRSVRDDFQAWYQFAHLSARRLAETLIRWSDVNWSANEIVTKGKGDRTVRTPITPSIRTILKAQVGRHPEYVFTFVAQRTVRRSGHIKGQRYPITYAGAKSRWRRDLAKSGVKNFWLHGLRHDRATKVLRTSGNLKIVQRVLNHSHISTTARYAHVTDDDVMRALERSMKSRKQSRSDFHEEQ
ncbi:tyrosine recombinase XerC [Rhizobium leguminosarum]|uniref:site-specific integrase n=1 Tax=Rhizobium leguminosarum TaxID=384 RepID=UPI003F9B657F